MLIFLTVVGLGLAVLVFLNGIQAGDRARRNPLSARESRPGHDGPPVLDPKKVLKMPSGPTRPRVCPVCGTMLAETDYLIAALEAEPRGDRRRQAHIYGCPYCLANGGVNLEKGRQLMRLEP